MVKISLLLHIVRFDNIFLERGHFPQYWKPALVIPLPKASRPQKFSDLRPVSFLPVLSKVLIKTVEIQVASYLQVNQILPTKVWFWKISQYYKRFTQSN